MNRSPLRWFFLLLLLPGWAAAQGKIGEPAPDFPPGLFSDGLKYRLSDLHGKVVVLFFYESKCPTCRGSIPERNEVVKAFQDKPVVFLAVGASDPMSDVLQYARGTGLAMPIFADSLGLMEKRYGQQISLQNIMQFRVIGPDGKIIGDDMTTAALEKILEQVSAEWKYDPKDYHAKLTPAIRAFEMNQPVAGMKLLAPLRKSKTQAVAASAAQLYAEVKMEGESWKEEADKLAEDSPLEAFDLYTRVAKVFAGDELARGVAKPMKKLAVNKKVSQEMAARKAFARLETQIVRASPAQKKQVLTAARGIIKKYPGTLTTEKVSALVKELGD